MAPKSPTSINPEAKPNPSRILLVDDHDVGRKALARLLCAMGFEVTDVGDATSAFDALRGPCGFDFVLTDLRLPDHDGRDVVEMARQLIPRPRISLMTGWDVEPGDSIRPEIDWIFFKPLDVKDMVAKLRDCSNRSNTTGV